MGLAFIAWLNFINLIHNDQCEQSRQRRIIFSHTYTPIAHSTKCSVIAITIILFQISFRLSSGTYFNCSSAFVLKSALDSSTMIHNHTPQEGYLTSSSKENPPPPRCSSCCAREQNVQD